LKARRIELFQFRNYAGLELDLGSNFVVLTGDNAQGKTNLLESVFLNCTGRSHRTHRDEELIREGEDRARASVTVERREGASKVETLLDRHKRKEVYINGAKAERIGDMMGVITCVLFSPESMELIKGGPSERRRFMNMALSQIYPAYFYYLQQYNRLLSHRNRLLKAAPPSKLPDIMPVWDEKMAECAAFLIDKRRIFIAELVEKAAAQHTALSEGAETLVLAYKPSVSLGEETVEDIAGAFLSMLAERREEDRDMGSTARGCHREDIAFLIDGRDARVYASQGQQRTAVLSVKLAEAALMHENTGEEPLLLLDDVFSELDPSRRAHLLHQARDRQVFLTLTELSLLGEIDPVVKGDMVVYTVRAGALTQGQ
jgi:DNA replication and repair protein RecF